MSISHPKHKSLYLDEYTGKWALRHTRGRSTSRCPVSWCKNPPACWYSRGKIYHHIYCYKCQSRKRRANNPIRYAFECLKGSAKKREIEFRLTFLEFSIWCKETGYADQKGFSRLKFHCDRIRNEEGYSIDNIQILSQGDNVRKRNADIKNKKQPNDDPF